MRLAMRQESRVCLGEAAQVLFQLPELWVQIHKKACEVYVWEDLLEEYVQKRNHADRTKLQEVREDRDEFIEELADRNREIVKLKMMNKVLQLALASTAPVAAMIAVTAAWVGK
ncbi:hypothetical protein ZWY2020_032356 [Hordeum vulgare]|nr:hypothetical protein ZWY2020_032356 [Hordeum vulgare]